MTNSGWINSGCEACGGVKHLFRVIWSGSEHKHLLCADCINYNSEHAKVQAAEKDRLKAVMDRNEQLRKPAVQ